MHLGLGSPKLRNILQPAPSQRVPTRPDFQLSKAQRRPNPSLSRHAPGDIWKQVLLRSVFQDLLHGDSLSNATPPSPPSVQRRFVRLESVGLSGLIWYELGEKTLTLERVFGDPAHEDPHGGGGGMDLDDLLDAVKARVVYFPAFACTSFIAGQTMSAFLANRLDITPRCVQEGFSVLLAISSPVMTETAPSCLDLSSWGPAPNSPDSDGLNLALETTSSALFPSTSFLSNLGNIKDCLSLTDGDPHLSLCVRSSSSKLPGLKNDSLPDGEQGKVTLSTVESILILTSCLGSSWSGYPSFELAVGLKSFLEFSDSYEEEGGITVAGAGGGDSYREGGLSSK